MRRDVGRERRAKERESEGVGGEREKGGAVDGRKDKFSFSPKRRHLKFGTYMTSLLHTQKDSKMQKR